ncbi:lysylphosphatidylglycerol synthase domain-containing protein [Marinilabilia rubra]|uniref:TIGR00374 family protein n=1 Tax=Marinilabilia rubra TaxID=2162893 RepID=A0A2U2BDB7_9BACT|nr:lysylphosphatidylglycerol synthase domain-containing protein [Marinilabilia rubra]PWE01065.1 hypothetical protein DDZ16_00830 [Marinilabilia rubra]
MQISPRFIKRFLALISFIAITWVVYRLWNLENWNSFGDYLSNHRLEAFRLMGIQLVLLFINLRLESRRWQLLIAPISNISIWKSFYQVLKGIQMGMITPARAGDPIGKSVFFKTTERWRVVLLSFAGSIIQNVIILVAAVAALFATGINNHPLKEKFVNYYSETDSYWTWGVVATVLIIVFLLMRHHLWSGNISEKFKSHVLVFKEHRISNLVRITMLTALRFLVFSFQFYLLLRFFGLNDIRNGFLSVFIYYGALSFLPSTGAGDLGLRASLALIIFGQTELAGPAIVMSSLLLWFFNLGIPAVLPSLSSIPSVFKQKIQKRTLPV